MKSNLSLQIPCLILCALPFLETNYKSINALDITVMALAVIAAVAVVKNILSQKDSHERSGY